MKEKEKKKISELRKGVGEKEGEVTVEGEGMNHALVFLTSLSQTDNNSLSLSIYFSLSLK